jgi:hypothetical protein
VNKSKTIGQVLHTIKSCHVLTEENLDDIGARLEQENHWQNWPSKMMFQSPQCAMLQNY